MTLITSQDHHAVGRPVTFGVWILAVRGSEVNGSAVMTVAAEGSNFSRLRTAAISLGWPFTGSHPWTLHAHPGPRSHGTVSVPGYSHSATDGAALGAGRQCLTLIVRTTMLKPTEPPRPAHESAAGKDASLNLIREGIVE